jgi:hypothetical protein
MAWPAPRSEIKTLIRNILSDTSGDVTQQDYADAVLHTEIDRAYRDVQIALDQSQGVNEVQDALVLGSALYDVTLAGSEWLSQARLTPNATTGMAAGQTVDRLLTPLTQEQGRSIMGGGEYATVAPYLGLPLWWWIETKRPPSATTEADAYVGIWPPPDAPTVAAFKLTTRHQILAPALTGDTSVVVTPMGSDVAIANRVAAWLAAWRGDKILSAMCENHYNQAIERMLEGAGGSMNLANEPCRDVFGIL